MLNAGVGRSDITPPVGIAHAGWGAATHERAEGVDMPFYATALYVTDGDIEIAIVDLDMGILTFSIDTQIREAVLASTGIDPDNLRLTATHTHSGPIGLGSWLEEGKELIGPYQDSLAGRVTEAVASAKWTAKPARVGVGSGECAINVNRRPTLPNGELFTGRNWDGFVDREVGVIGIDGIDGAPIATIVNYTCHPTILGPANKLLSPDYPGYVRKVVEQHVPGLCLFLQGAAGNCGPTHGFIGEVEVAEWLGTRLGLEAAKVRLEIDPVPRKERLIEVVPSGADLGMYEDEPTGEPDDTLRIVNHFVDLPATDMPTVADAQAEYDTLEAKLHEVRKTGDTDAIKEAVKNAKRAGITLSSARIGETGAVNMRIQAIRIGVAALVGTPIEAFAEIGAAVKERSHAEQTLFSGYSNGYQGYMPMADAYEFGGYEVNTTPYAAGAAEDTIEACVEAVNALWR
jgi:neutral ceramidase